MAFFDTLKEKLGFGQEREPRERRTSSALVPYESPQLKTPDFISTLQSKIGTFPLPSIDQPEETQRPRATFQDLGTGFNSLTRLFVTRPAYQAFQLTQDVGRGIAGDTSPSADFTPETPIEQAIFGKKPIQSVVHFQENLQTNRRELLESGSNPFVINSLAIMGSVAPMADFLGGGGSKKEAAEFIFKNVFDDMAEAGIKIADDSDAFKFLKDSGIDDVIAKENASLITKAKNTKQVKKALEDTAAKQIQIVEASALKRIDNLTNKQQGTKIGVDGATTKVEPQFLTADEMGELKFLKENVKTPERIIAANRLAESEGGATVLSRRATPRQFETADEFVDAQTQVFRGGQKFDAARIGEEGVPFSVDRKVAEEFARVKNQFDAGPVGEALRKKPGQNIVEDFFISPKAKIATRKDIPDEVFNRYKEANPLTKPDAAEPIVNNWAKENGFDAIDYRTLGKTSAKEAEIKVLNADILKSKDELKASFNQSNKNIAQVAETEALETAAGATKERKYITSAKASARVNESIKGELSGTYSVKANDKLVKGATDDVIADFDEAAKDAMTQSSDEAIVKGQIITDFYGNEIVNAASKAEKLRLGKEAAELINKQAETLTEAGRTVQAASLMNKKTPEGMLRDIARQIAKYNKANPGKQLPKLTAENVVKVMDEGRVIEKMAKGPAKDLATKKFTDELKSIIPTQVWDKMMHVWKAGLLTGLKTSGVNIASTFFNGVAEVVKDLPAVGIDIATSAVLGTKRTKAFTLDGLFEGGKEGFKEGWTYLKTGIPTGAETGLEFKNVTFNSKAGKVVQSYADGVFRILGAEDMPYYHGAFKRSLYEQASVDIINTKTTFKNAADKKAYIEDFIKNPTDEALEMANLDAKIATFKNDTQLGYAATSIRNLHPAAEIILPFAKTPSAVAAAVFDYTPAGAVVEIAKQLKNNVFDQKKFVEAIGRSVTGLGALWLGNELFNDDRITLEYPDTEKERAEWEATGKKEYSIKIGDSWVPLIQLGPMGSVIGIGGHIGNGYKETGSVSGSVIQGMAGGAKSLKEQSFLTGVKSFLDAWDSPNKASSYAGGLIGSIVPTIVSDIANATDKYQRRSYDKTLLGPAKGRIPGVREGLLPKIDVWGQPMERNRSGVATAISPVRLSKAKENPYNTEVDRLEQQGEDIRPTKIDRTQKSIKLDDVEYAALQRLYGVVVTQSLDQLLNNKDYQGADSATQAVLWKGIVKDARKASISQTMPIIIQRRYNLPESVDLNEAMEVLTELYKKSERFQRASTEDQGKVLLNLLGNE